MRHDCGCHVSRDKRDTSFVGVTDLSEPLTVSISTSPTSPSDPMEGRIPEEILRETLKYCLFITPIHAFLLDPAWQRYNHFAEYDGPLEMPPSDALLVCKRWLRIGTPLWYNTIILHSTRQVRGLSQALRANPGLGNAIRNVRLQGGYGKDLATVMQHASRMYSVALNIDITSKDSNAGILRVLPGMNPTRFYLHGSATPRLANQNRSALHDAVIKSVTRWKSLVSLFLQSHLEMFE